VSDRRPTDTQSEQPATLHRVIQDAIAEGLRECYKPPKRMSHGLMVLLMQLNEEAKAKIK
jgi:hypothetical protein